MTRILSALVLLPIVLGTIWYLPPAGTLALAVVAAALAFVEFRALAAEAGFRAAKAWQDAQGRFALFGLVAG